MADGGVVISWARWAGRPRDARPAGTGPEADATLLAGVRARDLAAFEALYRRFHPRLARFLLNLTHRPTIVDEVLNDTMMAVWEKPDSFQARSSLSTWLMAIAYRKAMRALRRQDVAVEDRGHERPDDEFADAMPDRAIDRARIHALLVEAMAGLSPDHRAVIDLTYFHEFGYREIAEIMECPVDTVKTRMFHARRHLRRLLAGTAGDWL